MGYAQRISSLVLSLRKKEKLRVRQTLQKIMLPILDDGFKDQVELVKSLILSEVNVREIEYVKDTGGIIKKKIKPNFKTLGRKLGKHMKAAAAMIQTLDQNTIANIEKEDRYELEIEGSQYTLSLEDFEISTDEIPGWQVASEGGITVALDVGITDELYAEGKAKEIVNRIQNIRKARGFKVTDRICVDIQSHSKLALTEDLYSEYIKQETLADKLVFGKESKGERFDLYDGVEVGIEVRLAKGSQGP